ncbi:tetratricopeptide repeat protein [Streptomyces sp. PCS3-D2]|uniref:tetratricopeptide repeat protein n=1 Tax=Streptomyces sp. PCS3-D2 TaxID=1460244 RepID=UPI000996EBE8|nr:tetratricopeptide repeat protein [Streptomyces sp. PCS3-D2]WKV70143.1 tetratricopeptide repeat protein [Streptomyces sp. PCS3-D2]
MAKWHWGRRRDGGGRSLARGTAVEGVRVTGDIPSSPPAQQVTGSGNAVADNGGIAVSGIYNDHSSVLLPPEVLRAAAKVKAPRGMDDLPYLPGHFVGRESELQALDAALKGSGQVRLQAVHGLGGVGKSALAAHWVATRAHSHKLRPVRWITADSPAGVEQGLAALAVALQPALAKVLTTAALAEYALQWLAGHTGWLLVLDNVTDPADIAALLARAPGGRFLITSRLATVWTTATTVIRLDVLDPAESLTLLTRATTAAGPRDLDGAAELCAELGHLPLAVVQAAAYLAQNPLLTPSNYVGLLREDPAGTYQQGGEGRTSAERTVARVWRVTLDRISELQPYAARVLRALAWYGPDRIPVGLLDRIPDHPFESMPTPRQVADAVGLLNAYSMIDVAPATRTLGMHRLVQGLTRTPDPADPHRDPVLIEMARIHATLALHEDVIPLSWRDPALWPQWRSLIPHIDALASNTPTADDSPQMAALLNQAGGYLHGQGLAGRAVPHLERALAYRERSQGRDHPDTSDIVNNLAATRLAIGDLAGAVALSERAVAATVRHRGRDHPLSIGAQVNLAVVRLEAGEVDRATAMIEQALADSLRLGGEAHYATIMVRSHLATAYLAAGHFDRALELQTRNAAISARVLGEDHPDTQAARIILTQAAQAAGDPARAVPLYERLRRRQERALGEDHPHTLATRSNLASAHLASGNPGRAIEENEQVVEDRMRVLGEDDPHTLAAQGLLADAYTEAGDTERSIPLSARVLEDRLRVLGEDHPDTFTARESLAGAHRAAGDLDRAILLCTQVLDDRLRVLGPNHPDTLNARNNLALLQGGQGAEDKAIALLEHTLAESVRALGEDHPHLAATRHNLAAAHLEAGNPGRAIPLLEQAVATNIRTLGQDHPRTVDSLHGLASAHREAGNAAQVALLCERIHASHSRTLGEHDAQTLTSASHLALARLEAGDPERALPLLKAAFRAQKRLLGPGHIDFLTTAHNLALAHHALGHLGKALRLYRKVLILSTSVLGEDDPLTQSAAAHHAAASAARGAPEDPHIDHAPKRS